MVLWVGIVGLYDVVVVWFDYLGLGYVSFDVLLWFGLVGGMWCVVY